MFRQNAFDKLVDKATSQLLMEPEWTTILQICDMIRQNDVQPKQALAAVKKKMNSPNPHTAMFAVQLLESMVKNCGSSVHDELTTVPYCQDLFDLVKNTTHDNVRQKMLELIQAWAYAFRKNSKHSALKEMMATMKTLKYKFPEMHESDAMFSADSAPVWADGEVCHRCRAQFTLVMRKHHCRACGQVFCNQCSSKQTTLPKFGIEKEVRVCDPCYEQVNKPVAAPSKDADMEEYLRSSLAQQNQLPPRKTEDEIREEEELQLALALSQSEAEHKEKEKMRATSGYFNYKEPAAVARPVERTPTPETQQDPELARYLNRTYWENKQADANDAVEPASPSAPSQSPFVIVANGTKPRENGVADNEIDEFVQTLKSQVEIFINRMKSNSSRGRSIANDTSVQTLFMNITAMHSKLLRYIQQHDDSRLYYERLQDKLNQVRDARAALDALREEHHEELRRQAEEAEMQRQMLMAHKLDIMRKKKQEYLQYQRQVALQRIQEQEREMQIRQEQQKQQYIMGPPQYFMGSPVHGQQFPPNSAPPPGAYGYQAYGPPSVMAQMGPPQSAPPQIAGPPPGSMVHQMPGPPPGYQFQSMPPGMQGGPQQHPNMPPSQGLPPPPGMQQSQGMPPPGNHETHPHSMMPAPQNPNMHPNQMMPPQYQGHPQGAPPANSQQMQSPQQMQPPPQMQPPQQQQVKKEEAETAELISFD